jgi:hypothetical protein
VTARLPKGRISGICGASRREDVARLSPARWALPKVTGLALAPVGWLAHVVLGQPAWTDHIVTTTLFMATSMTLGMTVWMRHRGHGWVSTAEMGAAMYASFVVLYPAYFAGAMSASDVMGIGHVLMLPAMLVVMLRRRSEYAGAHH